MKVFISLSRSLQIKRPEDAALLAHWIKDIIDVSAPTKRSTQHDPMGNITQFIYTTDIIFRDRDFYEDSIKEIRKEMLKLRWGSKFPATHDHQGNIWVNPAYVGTRIAFDPVIFASQGVRLRFRIIFDYKAPKKENNGPVTNKLHDQVLKNKDDNYGGFGQGHHTFDVEKTVKDLMSKPGEERHNGSDDHLRG
jgi:hypothetical protein